MPTLNEISHLRDSGFGQPRPRHGLNLLYWFVTECVDFRSGRMFLTVQVEQEEFGFHHFNNRVEVDDDEPLLDNQNLQYYEVGNLRYPGAEHLPDYVRKSDIYNNYNNNWNMDRIIVGLWGDDIERVYVTEHSNRTDFERSRTFRVSRGLIKNIRRMERKQFLQLVKNQTVLFLNQHRESAPVSRISSNNNAQPSSSWSWCYIPLILLLFLAIYASIYANSSRRF